MDEQELNYRPVNTTAILGFLLAVASGASLAFHAVWPLCLVALAVCWNASRTIKTNSEHMTGRSFALAGIFLAIFFCAGAFAKSRTADRLHQSDIDVIANQFMDYVLAKDYLHACDMMEPYQERQPSDEHLTAHYEFDVNAVEKIRDFRELEALKKLEAIDDPKLTIVERHLVQTMKFARMSSARTYEARSAENVNSGKTVKLLVLLERSSTRLSDPLSWRVKEFALAR